jgi:NNP family nitrate/nitrite transporter-like MFS transporter
MLGVATLPPLLLGTTLLFLAMGMLGMGNGAVFQLVPQRFSKEIGIVTGIVGAAGGLGGFLLPNVFGILKGKLESFSYGFVVFGTVAFACTGLLAYVATQWQGKFVSRSGLATGVEKEEPIAEPALPQTASV